jgi:ATP-dependent DNA helicase DinG
LSSVSPTAATARLDAVTAALPGHEDRPGQLRMAELVASAIEHRRHLVVQAGTGTGKTLAYLVPTIASGKRVVVATATKALQDQLAVKDLPFLDETMDEDFTWAVLKGRSNYVCLQRVNEVLSTDAQGELDLDIEDVNPRIRVEVQRLAPWAGSSPTGDLAEAPTTISEATTRAITVGSDECPGRERCPMGEPCHAERARQRAQWADVVVVNTYLYGLDVGSGGAILPDHDVVVFDEAHGLEDIMSDTVGVQVAPGRFVALAGVVRRILDDPAIIAGITDLADVVRNAIAEFAGQRLRLPYPDAVQEALLTARTRLEQALAALAGIDPTGGSDSDGAKQRRLRAQLLTTRTMEALDIALGTATAAAVPERDQFVDFVSGTAAAPRLELAPLDVGPALAAGVWSQRTAILTSATISPRLASRVGIPPGSFDEADVGSPFDYEHHSLLYCPVALPDPRDERYRAAVHDELTALITAAGGRTLALFTSWKAMDAAAEAVRQRVDVPILTQRDPPKQALVRTFAADEATCLFATAGLFQGVDVPGRTLSLVVIDRLPFPRPDDPLLSARRELLGQQAFAEIDVPRAATMLAQAAGRLIRTADDRGVVAVLDRRLGTAHYRWEIVNALPPMRRTRHRTEVAAFLGELAGLEERDAPAGS